MRKKIFSLFLVVLCLSVFLSGCSQGTNSSASSTITSMSQLENASIGAWSGSVCERLCREKLPNANYLYYNTVADMATSVMQGKTQAFCTTPAYFSCISAEIPELKALEETAGSYSVRFVLRPDARGDALCEQLNAYIAEARASGEIEQINEIWYGQDESLKVIDRSGLTGENGTIKLAVSGEAPISYIRGNEVVGSEVDMITRFCTKYGYDLEIDVLSFPAILPSMQNCKYDIAAATFEYSEERAEIVSFSDSAYEEEIILVVRGDSDGNSKSTWDSIKDSFYKTFIRFDRWKLFLDGVGQTLLITVLSMIGGTILGLAVYRLCRRGGKPANYISRFAMWLIDGTPMVVLLMIFYYIILGKLKIDGIWVAVLCFSLTFGSSMFGMITSGVTAVGSGQLEAARALGYTDLQAFWKLILPQAAVYFMPSYKSAVVNHIKATAIVGYIAVQDLTKVSDLVRSNTFEPFFPLFSTAVIYFILAWILKFVVGLVQKRINTKNRNPKKILSGLKGGETL